MIMILAMFSLNREYWQCTLSVFGVKIFPPPQDVTASVDSRVYASPRFTDLDLTKILQ